jgi:hypothetical protein
MRRFQADQKTPMKTNSLFRTGRVTVGALVVVIGFGLAIVAVFPTNSQSAPQRFSAKIRQAKARQAVAAATVPAPITPAPQDPGPAIGYENFSAPGVLVPVTTTEAGQQPHSVEWMGRNAGEPSVGSNWATGVAMFKSGLQSLFVTFNDSCPANGLSATWVNRAAPTSVGLNSDPISFTDRGFTDATGFHSRTFGGELTFLSPDTVKLSYTDDDGLTWVPDQTGGLASAVDHETIGAGIYHSPIPPRPPGTVYPYAVYYCSQDIAFASCSRSDDGGLHYGASVPIYSLATCGGIHGHVKVSPVDGTVYVPNLDCTSSVLGSDDLQAVVVSENNGATWTVRQAPIAIPGASGVGSDPAVGIDSNGRMYFLGASNGTNAVAMTSDDHGQTWQNIFDVGAVYGVKYVAFPAAVAGSAGRASVSFYGSSTGSGDSNVADFNGVWHLYVAHTFDGGLHWTTTDATPNAPMQRSGLLRGGGANITRNLLDFFDMTIDKDGRVLVGYVNGCEGGNCVQAGPTATGNAYTTTATIARQSSGRRMLAANDPASSTSKPGMPWLTQRRVSNVVSLQWSEADAGNLMINNYQILKGTAPGAETLLTTIAGTQIGGAYNDVLPPNDTTTYYYKVAAVNSAGSSCGNNEVVAPFIGDACNGLIIHRNDPTHPEANAGTATPASLLIDYIAVGEPSSSPGNFLFKMKVNDLSTVLPNSRWRIIWNSAAAETYPSVANDPVSGDPLYAQQFYVGMTTGPSGPPTFEYGTLADAGTPGVFVISETKQGNALAGSNFNADGTITVLVPKIAFGPHTPSPTAPAIGSLLGAVGGRTFTGDTPQTNKLERSNLFVDHTFVKAQSDNSYPAATYTVLGNNPCPASGLAAIGAVSRKTHGSVGDFDVDLPLSGAPGIECRNSGNNDHKIIVTFPTPVTVNGGNAPQATLTGTGSVSSVTVNGSVVTVNLTGVTNRQTITVTLKNVSDGPNTIDIPVRMGVLLGDANGVSGVTGSDVNEAKTQVGANLSSNNFRDDVDITGFVSGSDVNIIKSQVGSTLP